MKAYVKDREIVVLEYRDVLEICDIQIFKGPVIKYCYKNSNPNKYGWCKQEDVVIK